MPKDLLLKNLEACTPDEFPRTSDYLARYRALENFLNTDIHPVVTPGAMVSDKLFLTDHGPEHVRTVIKKASDLLNTSGSNFLTCYETYILLAAIHVHDIGNFYGRDGHESLSEPIMKKLGPMFGDDVEKRAIFKIAAAHGGWNKNGKDKISELLKEDDILNQHVRPRFLAALLRFADELADDRSRASRFFLEENRIPSESIIYHKYAYALHSVSILKDAISLKFDLVADDVTQSFKKDNKTSFLLDEIYLRTMKMHRERLYCMRFLKPFIDIERIDVTIQVFDSGYNEELASISYRLAEAGYPDENKPIIYTLCPNLQSHDYGSPLNGPTLRFYIKAKLKKQKQ